MTYPLEKNKLICLILLSALSCACRNKASPQQGPGSRESTPARGQTQGSSTQGTLADCPTVERPETSGTLLGEHLTEVSGVVVSRSNPEVMWMHNDSGDAARVYALDFTGTHLATVELPTSAHDFEDIALEPRTPGGDRIYVADTGDNKATRDTGVFIHRFVEPSIAEASRQFPRVHKVKHLETMRLNYPDGPRDAEALLVDPWNGHMVLLSKPRMDPAEIFIVEEFAEEVTPTFAGKLAQPGDKDFLHLVTGADITTDGRWIVVRTYDRIALFPRALEQSIPTALSQKPCLIAPAWLPQAEAIGFLRPPPSAATARPGTFSFITLGEGKAQPIHRYGVSPLPARTGQISD